MAAFTNTDLDDTVIYSDDLPVNIGNISITDLLLSSTFEVTMSTEYRVVYEGDIVELAEIAFTVGTHQQVWMDDIDGISLTDLLNDSALDESQV